MEQTESIAKSDSTVEDNNEFPYPHYKGNNVELMFCGITTMKPPINPVKGLYLAYYIDNYLNNGKNVLILKLGSKRKINKWMPLENYNNKLDSYWMKNCKFNIVDLLREFDNQSNELLIESLAFKKWKRVCKKEMDTCYQYKYEFNIFSGLITIKPLTYLLMTTHSLIYPEEKNLFIEIPLINIEKIELDDKK